MLASEELPPLELPVDRDGERTQAAHVPRKLPLDPSSGRAAPSAKKLALDTGGLRVVALESSRRGSGALNPKRSKPLPPAPRGEHFLLRVCQPEVGENGPGRAGVRDKQGELDGRRSRLIAGRAGVQQVVRT